MFEPRVGDHVDDFRAVFQLAQLFDGEKAHAREIRFHAEHAVELDGMADGFVDLQAELRAVENNRALPFGALRGGMQRDGFFGDARGACRPSRAIRPVRSLAACAGRRSYSDRSASEFRCRQSWWPRFPRRIASSPDESTEPVLEAKSCSIRRNDIEPSATVTPLTRRISLSAASSKIHLALDGNAERILEKRILPGIHVGALGSQRDVLALGERGGLVRWRPLRRRTPGPLRA